MIFSIAALHYFGLVSSTPTVRAALIVRPKKEPNGVISPAIAVALLLSLSANQMLEN